MSERSDSVRVLIVDDDPERARVITRSLEEDGCSCEHTRAIDRHTPARYDLVVCGMDNWSRAGTELLARLAQRWPTVPAVIVTRNGTVEHAVDAIKHGAFHFVSEPYDPAELHAVIAQAGNEQGHHPADNGASRERSEPRDFVRTSPAMRELDEAVTLVAQASAPVLILGESGTGKERVARAIHARGPRSGRPFVAVNTSAIPEQLLESEVFGHVRGAFTGATQARKGLLAEAEGGTLLLDEIGDMPLGLQAKLLRMIQFGEARPVGSDRAQHVDVRVIAATHRDLERLAREGRFREDLHYRLNVLPLTVPPLRARSEDVPVLAKEFLAAARERTPGSPVRAISNDAMRVLETASWLGNVRELESAIERLVVLGREETIEPRDVGYLQAPPMVAAAAWPTAPGELWSLKRVNASYVAWVLAQTGGNKARAAEILGVDLSTLYRWQHGASRGHGSRHSSKAEPPDSSAARD